MKLGESLEELLNNSSKTKKKVHQMNPLNDNIAILRIYLKKLL